MAVEPLLAEDVAFEGEGGRVPAYLVRTAGPEPRPGLVIIHEIFGLTDHIRDVSGRFAREGYVVLAPDLYGAPDLAAEFTPDRVRLAMRFLSSLPRRDPVLAEEALGKLPTEERNAVAPTVRKMLAGAHRDRMTRDLVHGVAYLRTVPAVRGDRIGSVGFCFGGNMSIRLACEADLAACVVFYGENPTPVDRVKDISGPVLGLYGGEDARINAGLPELVRAMAEHKKDFEMRLYPGAGHAFFNDTGPRYQKAAAEDAWDRVRAFLRRTLSA